MRKEFKAKTPELILIVTGKKDGLKLEDIFQAGLKLAGKGHVALSLYVAPKDRKNMLKAVRLMDVAGIFISEIDANDSSIFTKIARAKGPINTIVHKAGGYRGYYIPLSGRDGWPKLVSDCVELWTGIDICPKKLGKKIRGYPSKLKPAGR